MNLSPLAAACAVLAIAAGCGGDPAPAPAPVQPNAITPATTAAGEPTPTETVRRVALTRADLPDGFGDDRAEQGDEVAGQVTLDLCAADFASESRRIARHQVGFPYGDGDGAISNEVVEYAQDGAEEAMAELRRAVAECPRGYTNSKIKDVPDQKSEMTVLPSQPGWQPGSFAFELRLTDRSGKSQALTLVFQPHGNVISMLYVYGPKPLALLDSLAALLSTRLDTLAS